MSICQCVTKGGKRCTRATSTKPGDNHNFCWQHQNCTNPIIPDIPISEEPTSPVKPKSPPREDIVPIKISPIISPILKKSSPRTGQKKQVRFVNPSPKPNPSPIKPTHISPLREEENNGCITTSDKRETFTNGPHYEDLSGIRRNHNDVVDRLKIRHEMLTKRFGDEANFNKLTDADLKYMFDLYDQIVFGGELGRMVAASGKKLKFNAGSSAEKVAGSYVCKKDEQCLTISGGLFTHLFKHGEKGLRVNGLIVCDRLEALQIVFSMN